MKTDQSLAVDNLDVLGMLDDDSISYQDMNNGLFDYAEVQMFVVNWANISQGILRLRQGWLGECVITPTGVFKAELRGLTQALTQKWGDLFSPICRADLGDSKCKVNLASYQTTGTVATVISNNSFTTSGLDYIPYTGLTDATSDSAILVADSIIAGMNGSPTPAVPQPTLSPQTGSTSFAFIAVSDAMDGSATPVGFGIQIDVNGSVAGTFIDGGLGIAQTSFITTIAGDINAAGIGIQAAPYFPVVGPNGIRLILSDPTAQVNVTAVNDAHSYLTITSFADGFMDNGVITWTSGNNNGVSMEIKTYIQTNSKVSLFLSMKSPIQVGDSFVLTPGCDKRRETCYFKFSNMINFRGEPDMPGIDAVLTYPEAFQTMAQRPL